MYRFYYTLAIVLMLVSAIVFRVGREETNSYAFMLLLSGLVFYFIALYTKTCVKYKLMKDEYVKSRIKTKHNHIMGALNNIES